jgi:hypothetical protein
MASRSSGKRSDRWNAILLWCAFAFAAVSIIVLYVSVNRTVTSPIPAVPADTPHKPISAEAEGKAAIARWKTETEDARADPDFKTGHKRREAESGPYGEAFRRVEAEGCPLVRSELQHKPIAEMTIIDMQSLELCTARGK